MLGVPTVIPVVSDQPFSGDRYVYIFDAPAYSLGWNQEDDEGTEFSPTLRLVYRRDFAQGQSLALGLQYDWRQQEPDRADTGRKKSGYSVDVSYDIGW